VYYSPHFIAPTSPTASLAALKQLNKPRPFCLFPVTTLVGYLWLSLPCWLSLNYCLGPRRHSCPFCEHLLKSPQLWLPRESLVSYLGSLVQLPKPFSEVTEDFLSSTNWSLCHAHSIRVNVQGLVYVIPFAVIRGLLLSSLFNGPFALILHEPISGRRKSAETTATSHQPLTKHKTPTIYCRLTLFALSCQGPRADSCGSISDSLRVLSGSFLWIL
jgi:hypothetical protein